MDQAAIPVAPGGEGLLGHNAAMRNDRLGVLGKLARAEGPLLRLRVPPPLRAVVANEPDVVQELLVEKAGSITKSDMLRFALWNLAGEGLFTSTGDLWKRQRRLMAPLFTPKALEAYARDMVACTLRTIEGWGDDRTLSLAHETTRLTMGIAAKTLFEADTFSEADEIGDALTVALDWTGYVMARPSALLHVAAKRACEQVRTRTSGALSSLAARGEQAFTGPVVLWGPRGRALAGSIAFLDAHVQRMIDDRRRTLGTGRTDLLSRLIEAHDEGGTMDDRQVRDEVLTLFVAGHETTATGLAWTLYLAARDPAVYAAMEREADSIDDPPTVADLPRLEVIGRAFREALRLYPPVYMFGRDTLEPMTLAGYTLRPRTNVMVSPYGLHHDPKLWPDPERFDPDRFLPEREAGRHRYAWLPFGAGPRVCIGNHFAMMEAALALATLLRRYRFEPAGDDVPEPSATLRPKHGVPMRVVRRPSARRAATLADLEP
ncbi:MAG: cytochrome P450 [Myxococcales bacterium]|nr:cytochrome P450 [Myxococcales bacterium]